MSVALLVGCGLLIAGLEVVRVSPLWGFTYSGAMSGVLPQLSVTGPAAVLIAAATAANVLAGAVALRLLGGPAYRGLSELALSGFAAAVVLDAGVLFVLGSAGLLGWPELLALHATVAVAYVATRRRRPLMAGPMRMHISRPAAWWLLIVAVWAGPLIVQLASPAVPFMDVLPNHVAPVEHIRVFGSFTTLTTSPSPIYGPSRLMLGYVALLGQLTTLTNLDAVLAEAAFALPLTILLALAVRRLARDLFGGSASFWVLLTFPLTFTFMRIPDSRDTVVVFPLAAWALCTIAGELRRRKGPLRPDEIRAAVPPASSRRPDLALAFALGGAFLVHPVIGLVAITAAGGALILYPACLARRLVPALGGGLVLAVPQALTMAGIDAPSWIGAVFVAAGIGTAFVLAFVVGALADRGSSDAAEDAASAEPDTGTTHDDATDWASTAEWGRAALVGAAIAALLIVARSHIPQPGDPASEVMIDFPHLVWLCLGGVALSVLRLGRGWIVLGCGIAAGLAAWAASGLVGYADLTQQSVHYEVPKSVEYWLPVMLAIGASAALAAVSRQRRLGLLGPVVIGVFLLVAVYPTTQPLATNVQSGEHRASESVGLALREAERGYWDLGYPGVYPDARLIIDAPRQEVVDELRSEEAAGRLGPSTRVLHIASSFQQWVSVPIGVFTGAMETSISLQPELSIHTVGGRLLGFDQLDAQLTSGYGYVVLEPAGLAPDLISEVQAGLSAGGYRQIWNNSQAMIYTRG